MTINDTRFELVHLRRAAELAAALSNLPAVATTDWCERAAASITHIQPHSICCVRIGVQAKGDTSNPQALSTDPVTYEAAGAFNALSSMPVSADAVSAESETASDWWLAAAGPGERPGFVRDLPGGERWPMSMLGRRWAGLGVSHVLVGSAPITVRGQAMLVLVEIGSLSSARPLDQQDAGVLAAVLPELARRAAVAFEAVGSGHGERLTSREQEVLALLSQGKTVKQIAEMLARSPHTVHDHVKALHRKLKASSRGELVARALGHLNSTPVTEPPTTTVVQGGGTGNRGRALARA